MTVFRVISLLLLAREVLSIWPPPHEIHLEDGETFVISEISESDDIFSDEDEMIPVEPSPDSEKKYFMIHQIALHQNKRELTENQPVKNITKFEEHNFDLDEAIPWEGGFVDTKGNFIQPENEHVYYLNEMAKRLIDSKIKRKREEEKQVEEKVENYDYGSFKTAYQKEVEAERQSKDKFNYTDVKEDETVEEAVDAVMEFKDAKNCSAESNRGIGIAALKCIVIDLQTSKSTNSTVRILEKILRITLIWFCVYVVIAIPCWCQRGWCCCCCCCCKMCRPRETIDEAKRFFTQNPPGVLIMDGKKIEYPPTTYEIYTQQRLEKALFNL
ncbi:uncharacterized protein LOC135124444 [Zophobas morio]|uniref:uncharacterized protein LOC135124444 n=1 Tax=Zophobas morio TaxID=2755281 RepID=UPI0030838336